MAKQQSNKLPDWLDRRLISLESKFKKNTFKFEDASSIFNNQFGDNQEKTLVVLSELKKSGLLSSKPSSTDKRKKEYKVVSTEKNMSKISRSDLESILKRAADLIRTKVDYKFILVLLFFKRLSDKWQAEFKQAYQEAVKNGFSDKDAETEAKRSAYHDFDLPEKFLWDNIRQNVAELPAKFSDALKEIAKRNSQLKDVVDNADFVQFARSREHEETLRQLVELFSEKRLYDVSPDVMGDAYEWILRYFAPQKAKEGEAYTPREVIRLLIKILDPKQNESICDPACGSGGMLIIAHEYVREIYGKDKAGTIFLFGQEGNSQTTAFCRMNLYIHDIRDAQIIFGDTLDYPKFKDKDELKNFDIVIANPPWNQDGYGEDRVEGRAEFLNLRFPYGMVPKQSADWLWIQHMLASSNDQNGRVGVVIDNGALFRGGKEKTVRTAVLEKDLIEAVLLLPEKLFYNTGAPGAIMILRKNKPAERKNKVAFINASDEKDKHPEVRKLNILTDNNVKKIVETYSKFKEINGFSKIVTLDQIKENDYNLNVSLYAYKQEEHEDIDIKNEYKLLQKVEGELKEKEKTIEGFLKELDIL